MVDWRNQGDMQMPALPAGTPGVVGPVQQDAMIQQAMPVGAQAPATGQQEGGLNFWNYLWIIRKRLWVVVLMVLLAGVVSAVYLWIRKPVYVATAEILVQPQYAIPLSNTMAQSWYQPGWRNYSQQTHIQIIRGRVVMEKVVRSLKLVDRFAGRLGPEQMKLVREGLEDIIPSGLMEGIDEENEDNSGIQGIADRLGNAIRVTPVQDSFVLLVECGAGDPQLAADIVNATVDSYMEYDVELRQKGIQQVLEWLRKQQEEYQNRLAESNRRLVQATSALDTVSVIPAAPGGGDDESSEKGHSVLMARISTLESEVVTLELGSERMRDVMETLRKWIDSNQPVVTLPPSLGTPTDALLRIVSDIQTVEAKLTAEMNQFGPKHPDVISLVNMKSALEQEARKQLEIAYQKAKADYELETSRLQKLNEMLQQAKTRARTMAQAQLQLDMIRQDTESYKHLYETILNTVKQTDLAGDIQNSNVQVLSPALVPRRPQHKDAVKVAGFLIFLGLACGIGLAFLLDAIDNSVRDMEDVERFVGLPVIGFVGNIRESLATPLSAEQERLPVLADPSSHTMSGEYLRAIRTNVVFSAAGEKKVLLLTSSLPGEGKTTLVSNLAVMLAYGGKRVLLIDADMRRPMMHRVFGIDRDPGLSNYLVGANTVDEIIKPTVVEGLHLVCSGPVPPNQAELLQSDVMTDFIETLRDRYDFVLFDTPPVCSVTDAVVLSLKCDGVLVVVRAGKTSRHALKTATRLLRTVKSAVMGALINGFSLEPSAYYYGRYGGYAYGYGYYYYHYYYRTRKGEKGKEKKGSREKRKA